jgi:hypothetical protein
MKLLKIDENGEVQPNVEWIQLIPQFKALFKDSQGKTAWKEGKTKGRKYLGYIYFMLDFSSPIRDYNDDDKHLEALRYTGLTSEDVKQPKVAEALDEYKKIQLEACRSLRSFRAATKVLASMDEYLENVDFNKTDKQGKLMYTVNQAAANVAILNKTYDELSKLEKRVETDLAQNTGIRGKSNMSDKELRFGSSKTERSEASWNESGANLPEGPTLVDISEKLK